MTMPMKPSHTFGLHPPHVIDLLGSDQFHNQRAPSFGPHSVPPPHPGLTSQHFRGPPPPPGCFSAHPRAPPPPPPRPSTPPGAHPSPRGPMVHIDFSAHQIHGHPAHHTAGPAPPSHFFHRGGPSPRAVSSLGGAMRPLGPGGRRRPERLHIVGSMGLGESIFIGSPTALGTSMSGPETVSRVLIPNLKIGAVIGKGGAIIKHIREVSGAKVTISDSCTGLHDEADDRMVTAAGMFNSVQVAFSHILSHAGYLGPGAEPLADLTGDPECVPNSFRLLIPNIKAGGLIGRGGMTIKAIREHSGARIEISSHAFQFHHLHGPLPPPPGPPLSPQLLMDRVMTVTGSFDACLRAHHLVASKLMEVRPSPLPCPGPGLGPCSGGPGLGPCHGGGGPGPSVGGLSGSGHGPGPSIFSFSGTSPTASASPASSVSGHSGHWDYDERLLMSPPSHPSSAPVQRHLSLQQPPSSPQQNHYHRQQQHLPVGPRIIGIDALENIDSGCGLRGNGRGGVGGGSGQDSNPQEHAQVALPLPTSTVLDRYVTMESRHAVTEAPLSSQLIPTAGVVTSSSKDALSVPFFSLSGVGMRNQALSPAAPPTPPTATSPPSPSATLESVGNGNSRMGSNYSDDGKECVGDERRSEGAGSRVGGHTPPSKHEELPECLVGILDSFFGGSSSSSIAPVSPSTITGIDVELGWSAFALLGVGDLADIKQLSGAGIVAPESPLYRMVATKSATVSSEAMTMTVADVATTSTLFSAGTTTGVSHAEGKALGNVMAGDHHGDKIVEGWSTGQLKDGFGVGAWNADWEGGAGGVLGQGQVWEVSSSSITPSQEKVLPREWAREGRGEDGSGFGQGGGGADHKTVGAGLNMSTTTNDTLGLGRKRRSLRITGTAEEVQLAEYLLRVRTSSRATLAA